MAEIRADDLSLTESEVQALLQALGAASLSAAALRLLHQRTEGWAAGIQLSALAEFHPPHHLPEEMRLYPR